ncbi:MAG: site-2 protease family protein [Gammaproteobacteria bacterium]|nr:site-2 protease family protein [Gammaproteobacteria bacterium]
MRSYPLFKLLGFEVRLDPSWLVLAFLVTWTLAEGVYPDMHPDFARQLYWWMGLASALGVFFSIVFHEFCHCLVARYYGLPIRGITLFIFGGVAEMGDEVPSPKAEFRMAAAGPIASLALAWAFQQFTGLGESLGAPIAVTGVLGYLALINTVLAVFNLVPAFPLDGGRMLRAALWAWKGDMLKATRISSRLGSSFGVLLMILGVLSFVQGNFIGGTWWVLIGAFVRGAARASYNDLLMRHSLKGRKVRDFMTIDPVTVLPDISLETLVSEFVYRHHFKMFPVVSSQRVLGCISIDEIRSVPRENWGKVTVAQVMRPCTEANSVSADAEVMELLPQLVMPMASSRRMVMEGDRLVGMVSMRDLRELIALRLQLEPTSTSESASRVA